MRNAHNKMHQCQEQIENNGRPKGIKININGYAYGIKGRNNTPFIKFSESRISHPQIHCYSEQCAAYMKYMYKIARCAFQYNISCRSLISQNECSLLHEANQPNTFLPENSK